MQRGQGSDALGIKTVPTRKKMWNRWLWTEGNADLIDDHINEKRYEDLNCQLLQGKAVEQRIPEKRHCGFYNIPSRSFPDVRLLFEVFTNKERRCLIFQLIKGFLEGTKRITFVPQILFQLNQIIHV